MLSGRLFYVDWSHPRPWQAILEAPFEWDWSHAKLAFSDDLHNAIAINSKGPYDQGPRDPTTNKLVSWSNWEKTNLTTIYDRRQVLSSRTQQQLTRLDVKKTASFRSLATRRSRPPLSSIVTTPR